MNEIEQLEADIFAALYEVRNLATNTQPVTIEIPPKPKSNTVTELIVGSTGERWRPFEAELPRQRGSTRAPGTKEKVRAARRAKARAAKKARRKNNAKK